MKILVLVLSVFCVDLFAAQNVKPRLSQAEIDQKVEQLLSKMTLQEKVGQMTQISLDIITKDYKTATEQEFDMEKLEDAIVKHGTGSVLNIMSDELPAARPFSQEKWHEVISKIQEVATKKTRLKIPVIYGIDAIHGAQYTEGATIFPQSIAMAATRNKDLNQQMATITAKEVKASGIPWNFCPLMDVARQPLWSRVFETYGEDPYLVAQLGSTYVKAQEKEGIATSIKHYVGYSFPWSGKDRTPVHMSERYLRDVFLPPFAAGVKAGAKTVMINSTSIDGTPGHANKKLLTDVLRGELGFKGFTISDWEDIEQLHLRHRIASTPEEAVKIAVMAGVDMSMVPYSFSFYDHLVSLAKKGEVPMSRINEAVRRILKVKYEIGLFENPVPQSTFQIGNKESEAVNLKAAQEAITLLKNEEKILPLAKNLKVLVAGPNANLLSRMNGGWTMTWLGQYEHLYPKNKLTALKAIEEKIGRENVYYTDDVKEAVAIATQPTEEEKKKNKKKDPAEKRADVAILFIGEKTYTEIPGNINSLDLDEEQTEFVKEIQKTNIPMILVLLEGRTRIIRTIEPKAKGIVMAYLPGMEGGKAIADVLFGDINPSGKLPLTYPKYANALTLTDHFNNENFAGNKFDPQWPFGFGLSYTTFAYSDLKLSNKKMMPGQKQKVSVKVTNTGDRAGKEAVELYMTDVYASVARPVRQLKGFEKIELQPGESKTVTFTLNEDDLSFVGLNNKRIVEPGEFVITVADQKQSFNFKK